MERRISPGHDESLLHRAWRQAIQDDVLGQSAKMSFYFLLSFFPLLLLLIAGVGFLLDSETLPKEALAEYLAAVLPPSTAGLVKHTLDEFTRRTPVATLSIALLFWWWSATRGMRAVIDGMNVALQITESRPWWKTYAVASGLTLAVIVLFATGLTAVIHGQDLLAPHARDGGVLNWLARSWFVSRWSVSLLLVLLAFNLVYRYAPDLRQRRWQWFAPGTLAGAAFWLLASAGLRFVVREVGEARAAQGSIGAVIALLLWLYVSGIAFLAGAELNSQLNRRLAHREDEAGDGVDARDRVDPPA